MTKIVLIISSLIASAWAYSAGAPESVCDDMTPKHPVQPQSTPLPYTIEANKKDVKIGEIVQIKIGGKPFKGYLVQVREGDKAVGAFGIPAEDRYSKTINCHGGRANSATHKNAVDKTDLVLKWKAPNKPGNYVVYVTVAEDGGTFWAGKPTETIRVH